MRILGRGALSLRLGAQSPLPYRERGGGPASSSLRTAVATTDAAVPVRLAQALGNSTSPGTGEVASLSEPERALSRSRSRPICKSLQYAAGKRPPRCCAAACARPPGRVLAAIERKSVV